MSVLREVTDMHVHDVYPTNALPVGDSRQEP